MSVVIVLCAALLAFGAAPARAQVGLYVSEWSCGTRTGPVDVAPDGSVCVGVPGALRRYSLDGTLLQTIGIGWFGRLPGGDCPRGVVFDAAGIGYLADDVSASVHVFAPSGERLAVWATGGAASTAIAMDAAERIYVADAAASALRVYSTGGTLLATWPMPRPVAVDVDRAAGMVYVVVLDPGGQGSIRKYDLDGQLLLTFGALESPNDMAVSPRHEIYVTEHGAGRVSVFSSDGRLLGALGSPLFAPEEAGDTIGVACAADGSVVVSHQGRGVVQSFARVDVTASSRKRWGALKARYR